jgi:hypothetical protein
LINLQGNFTLCVGLTEESLGLLGLYARKKERGSFEPLHPEITVQGIYNEFICDYVMYTLLLIACQNPVAL